MQVESRAGSSAVQPPRSDVAPLAEGGLAAIEIDGPASTARLRALARLGGRARVDPRRRLRLPRSRSRPAAGWARSRLRRTISNVCGRGGRVRLQSKTRAGYNPRSEPSDSRFFWKVDPGTRWPSQRFSNGSKKDSRTAQVFNIRSWFGRKVDQSFLDDLEARLIQADVGVKATARVVDRVREAFGDKTADEDLLTFVKDELKALLVIRGPER